jgi:hypothetical protein
MAKFLLPLSVLLTWAFAATGFALGSVACGVFAAYLVSLYVHPNRDCISCGGHKTHGPEGSRNFRRCWTCGGHGDYPRLGVRLFRRNVIRGLSDGKHGRNW